MSDTIYALSSGRPPAAIAVMRVSGPDARDTAAALTGSVPPARRAVVRDVCGPSGEVLDRALVVWFPGPRSATGEDLLELHLHGGLAVVRAVEAALADQPGLRAAEGGEFTRRALYNGRIDLAQAESLAELLAAETESARRAAIAGLDGALGRMFRDWERALVEVAALIEAEIDFDDEGDVVVARADVDRRMDAIVGDMRAALSRPTVERAAAGLRIVLAGPPNVGKSSLFNAMVSREAAIVSPVPGTTRDVLEAAVLRGGQRYTLVDTAGDRADTDNALEREGIERGRQVRACADLILWLADYPPPERNAIWVWARADLPDRRRAPRGAVEVSTLQPQSIEQVWRAVEQAAVEVLDEPLLSNDRQIARARTSERHLVAARDCLDLVLVAEHVRLARYEIAALRGHDATEQMLDALFARFCVGK